MVSSIKGNPHALVCFQVKKNDRVGRVKKIKLEICCVLVLNTCMLLEKGALCLKLDDCQNNTELLLSSELKSVVCIHNVGNFFHIDGFFKLSSGVEEILLFLLLY